MLCPNQLLLYYSACVCVCVCVLVFPVPHTAYPFYYPSEDILAGPPIFKGLFEGHNMVLRLVLELSLG